LYLEENQLENLPPEIGNLQNLTEFEIFDNSFSKLKPAIIQYIENSSVLRGIADVFFDKEDFSYALQFYLKAIENKSLPKDYFYVGRCYAVLGELDFAIKYMLIYLPLSSYWDKELTVNIIVYIYSQLKDYENAYEYQKKLIEVQSIDNSIDYNSWFNLSFYSLFVKKYDEAIFAAQKSLEINPDAKSVETNLALGYLLNNQWNEAEEIFLRWRGKIFPDDQDRQLCDDIFLGDIKALEDAGIHHPDFEKVKEMFRKE
jgi:tetratricopeptide (TPR) repeat protein